MYRGKGTCHTHRTPTGEGSPGSPGSLPIRRNHPRGSPRWIASWITDGWGQFPVFRGAKIGGDIPLALRVGLSGTFPWFLGVCPLSIIPPKIFFPHCPGGPGAHASLRPGAVFMPPHPRPRRPLPALNQPLQPRPALTAEGTSARTPVDFARDYFTSAEPMAPLDEEEERRWLGPKRKTLQWVLLLLVPPQLP